MKIAPIMRVLQGRSGVEVTLVHTGQHYDENLSRVFFEELEIPRPAINMEVGSAADRLEHIAAIKERFEPVLGEQNADLVIVVGDVNSTLACAEVAKSQGVKVAHVEAGLRSFDREMPEELNRIAVDQISDYLFTTERSGNDNLKLEGVRGEVHFVGNVMIDTLAYNLKRAEESDIITRLGLCPNQFIVSTFHRPSNVDTEVNLSRIVELLVSATERATLVLPLHPRTRSSLEKFGMLEDLLGLSNLKIIEPLGYLDFLRLVSAAKLVLTDSGGIQEETTWLGIPCITMRKNTERPVTVDLGTNVLVGEDVSLALSELDKVFAGSFKAGRTPDLWDGQAAVRIADTLVAPEGFLN